MAYTLEQERARTVVHEQDRAVSEAVLFLKAVWTGQIHAHCEDVYRARALVKRGGR